jgi:lipid-A-disaccharide synthase
MPQVVLVAGEASGDANGAALAKELRKKRPDLDIWGGGGPRMKEAGVDIVAELSSFGAIGIIQSLKVVPRLLGEFKRIKGRILSRRPDVFVPIDFGAFNIRLADEVKDAGIKVVYYFPPSSWRREVRDPSLLYQATDVVITPFKWSEDILRRANIDARFVGHPLLDLVRPEQSREDFRTRFPEGLILGILPGSRGHEIRHILPVALDACEILRETIGQVTALIGAAPGTGRLVRSIIESRGRNLAQLDPVVEEGSAHAVMAHSDLLIVCSGTATLEAAILGTPMVIVYKGPWVMRLEYLFRRNILQGGFAGMPNIIAEKEICPELLGDDASPRNIAAVVADLWKNSEKQEDMKAELSKVRDMLGTSGATERAARIVLETGGLL